MKTLFTKINHRRETVESQYQQKHNHHTIKQEVNQMAVIKETKNGSGGVIRRIHDDSCKNNTTEDNQKIIDNVSRIVNDYYIRKSVG